MARTQGAFRTRSGGQRARIRETRGESRVLSALTRRYGESRGTTASGRNYASTSANRGASAVFTSSARSGRNYRFGGRLGGRTSTPTVQPARGTGTLSP